MSVNRKTQSLRQGSVRGNKKSRVFRHAHSRHNFFNRLMRHYPRWTWWVGGLGIVVFYVWIFYYIFVGPFGFRWRALYGDAKYPEGYEIRGIDISHHQGDID